MLKKILSLTVVMLMIFSLSACNGNASDNSQTSTNDTTQTESVTDPSSEASSENTEPSNTESAIPTETPSESRILITFFSRAGDNIVVGNIEKGNTHILADMIAEQTGGNLFQIETVVPYPEDYRECTDVAKEEQNNNARPELTGSVENMQDYDVVFLGYPNWWGDMPMAVYTFLESYDFSGKTIVPFCTHEGSGLSNTEASIAGLCPDAEVLNGLSMRGNTAQNSQDEAYETVINWLKDNGFVE